jgi:hypothetical protein
MLNNAVSAILNQQVAGSSPAGGSDKIKHLSKGIKAVGWYFGWYFFVIGCREALIRTKQKLHGTKQPVERSIFGAQ